MKHEARLRRQLQALAQVARGTWHPQSVERENEACLQQLVRAGWLRSGSRFQSDIVAGTAQIPWRAVTPVGLEELRRFDPEAAACVDRARTREELQEAAAETQLDAQGAWLDRVKAAYGEGAPGVVGIGSEVTSSAERGVVYAARERVIRILAQWPCPVTAISLRRRHTLAVAVAAADGQPLPQSPDALITAAVGGDKEAEKLLRLLLGGI